MKKLPNKEYNEVEFVKYNAKKYGLIIDSDNERFEVILDDISAKALAGRMLVLIDVQNTRMKPNKN